MIIAYKRVTYCWFAFLCLIVFLIPGSWMNGTSVKNANAQSSIDYLRSKEFARHKRRSVTEDILVTPYRKIEHLTSQETGIGYGRPGTEEFLNADILIKLKGDENVYGFSLIFSDAHGHGPSKAMFDILLSALVHDLKVEIVYYEKQGAKQIARVSVKR